MFPIIDFVKSLIEFFTFSKESLKILFPFEISFIRSEISKSSSFEVFSLISALIHTEKNSPTADVTNATLIPPRRLGTLWSIFETSKENKEIQIPVNVPRIPMVVINPAYFFVLYLTDLKV